MVISLTNKAKLADYVILYVLHAQVFITVLHVSLIFTYFLFTIKKMHNVLLSVLLDFGQITQFVSDAIKIVKAALDLHNFNV